MIKIPEKLEDQIDIPIKKCVAMINLLGMKTLWACCGFDYKGQPKFKDHTYGKTHIYIDFKTGLSNLQKLSFIRSKTDWSLSIVSVSCTDAWLLEAPHRFGPNIWTKKNSIHFHESSNISIKILENVLISMKDLMVDAVDLIDENTVMKEHFEYWQHDPAEDWIIKKEDVI